eukprot:TRINITY_DN14611_c0_g1_i1.p1 TRINITY_DN14611_c0_g1~~TRINITY_DN14611_c0_g1_i1.p1  ORF type:complete len:374 (-),score=59.04 TRINITY_DN14611_c0_g1_i1:266-1387(-)
MNSLEAGNSEVRSLVQRSHEVNNESRAQRRLKAQSRGRNINLDEYREEVTEKENKTLINLCKTGKIDVNHLKRLSKAFTVRCHSEQFLNEDGCLHALVGLLSGSDWNKQILALYCLANLTGQDLKAQQIARSAGPYLITLVSGSNTQLMELACSVLVNLTQSKDEGALSVLINQEVVPSLIQLSHHSRPNLQELSYQTLYNLLTHTNLEGETLNLLCQEATASLNRRSPVHLLWVLFSLSSNQMMHSALYTDDLLTSLLQIATYEIFQKCDSRPLIKVLTPIVRILGNLCAGPESVDVAIFLVRQPDLYAILTALLSTNYTSLCQETVWWLANIVNNENVRVQEEFVEMDLMEKLENPAIAAIARLDPYAVSN